MALGARNFLVNLFIPEEESK